LSAERDQLSSQDLAMLYCNIGAAEFGESRSSTCSVLSSSRLTTLDRIGIIPEKCPIL
jgi:hypothetical protein